MPKVLDEKEATRVGSFQVVKRNQTPTLQSKFSRTYYVLSDNTSQGEPEITATIGIPPISSLLYGAPCVKHDPREVATIGRHPSTGVICTLWEVKCDFDSDVDTEESNQSPEARTPNVSWTSEFEEHPIEQDAITGDPIETVPGDLIPLTVPIPIPILEVRRFQLPPFDPDIQLDYMAHTNSATFYGAPPGCVLMSGIQASEVQVVDKVRVVEVSYQLKFRVRRASGGGSFEEDGWASRPLHKGPKFLPAVGKPPEQALDKLGNPTEFNLKEDGTQLPFNSPVEDRVYLKFNVYPKANFNNLNLGPF